VFIALVKDPGRSLRPTPRAALPSATLGALCAVGAACAFTMGDMAVKALSDSYPLHQVTLIRSIVALAVLIGLVVPITGGPAQLRTRRPGIHLIRGCFMLGANMAFFLALAAMPLADATAIFFISPTVIAVFSVIFLSETVGPRRWAAIGVGFLGVLIMIRPGTEAFTPVALLPLAAATCYAALHMLTRRLGVTDSAATMAVYMQAAFLIFSTLVGLSVGDGRFDTGSHPSQSFLLRAWVWPDAGDAFLFFLTGLGSAVGGFLISQAYRICEAALIAPLEYAAMPMAIFWGFVVFAEWPDRLAWSGIFLIVGSGVYMIWRETRARRAE
jgi:drug/metabolite transporter (DMT)-like permease